MNFVGESTVDSRTCACACGTQLDVESAYFHGCARKARSLAQRKITDKGTKTSMGLSRNVCMVTTGTCQRAVVLRSRREVVSTGSVIQLDTVRGNYESVQLMRAPLRLHGKAAPHTYLLDPAGSPTCCSQHAHLSCMCRMLQLVDKLIAIVIAGLCTAMRWPAIGTAV